jgi:hypothetical protein
MRRTWVYVDGVAYEKGARPEVNAPAVIDDIAPYRSMIDGTWITSRSEHRAHLQQHGCREVGNDAMTLAEQQLKKGFPEASPQKRKELIVAQVDAMRHEDFKSAIKKDADRVKWNSNY